jgi:tRNA (adenine57-N1/adenine58-N1)-methyltransferase
MYETLLRPHEVNQVPVLQTIEDIHEKLKKAEQKREVKRLKQIASSQHGKRKREGDADDELEVDGATIGTKRVKTDDEDASTAQKHPDSQDTVPEMPVSSSTEVDVASVASPKICLSKAMPEVRGHTSYLTFACLLPALLVTSPAGSPVEC